MRWYSTWARNGACTRSLVKKRYKNDGASEGLGEEGEEWRQWLLATILGVSRLLGRMGSGRGNDTRPSSLVVSQAWMVCLLCGLLRGLGFRWAGEASTKKQPM